MILSLEQIKQHLNIDNDYTAEDIYLIDLATVAEDATLKHLNIASFSELGSGDEIPASVVHAMLLLVGNFYANREPVSYSNAYKLPYSYEYLLNFYKNY